MDFAVAAGHVTILMVETRVHTNTTENADWAEQLRAYSGQSVTAHTLSHLPSQTNFIFSAQILTLSAPTARTRSVAPKRPKCSRQRDKKTAACNVLLGRSLRLEAFSQFLEHWEK